jgi:threonine dehydrogenase-like Zn-dependent dehydrogenase
MLCYGTGPLSGYLQGVQAELVSVPAADTTLLLIPEGISDDKAILLTDNLPSAYLEQKRGCRPGSIGDRHWGPVQLVFWL